MIQHIVPEALCPRQRVLERIAEVEDDPSDDDVVIKADVDNHNDRSYSYSSEVWEEFLPDENRALSEALSQQ